MEERLVSLTKRVEELETWIAELVKWTKCPIVVTATNLVEKPEVVKLNNTNRTRFRRPCGDSGNKTPCPSLVPTTTDGDDDDTTIRSIPLSRGPLPVKTYLKRERRSSIAQKVDDKKDSVSDTLSSNVAVDVIGLIPIDNEKKEEEEEDFYFVPSSPSHYSDLDGVQEEEESSHPSERIKNEMEMSHGPTDHDYSLPLHKQTVEEPPAKRGRGRPRTTSLKPKPVKRRSKSQVMKKTKTQRLTPLFVPPASTTASMDPTVRMTRLLQDEMSELGIDLNSASSSSVASRKYERDRRSRTTCRICSVTFNLEVQLKAHLKKIHGLSKNPGCSIARACPHCGKIFYHKTKYTIHLSVHSEDRPCQCDVCGIGFKTDSALKTHKDALHAGPAGRTVFTCEKCGASFVTKPSFDKHTLKEHSEGGVNPLTVKCHICGFFIKDKEGLRRHIRNVHEEGKLTHACHLCGRLFAGRGNLLRHIQIVNHDKRKRKEKPHVKINQGSFKCHICGQPFTNKNNMEKHVERHLNPESHPQGGLKQIKWMTQDPRPMMLTTGKRGKS